MEQIAIIADIHSNATALDAALEDIKKRGIKRIMCLGDMVVKCSSPRECVKKILPICEVVIKGNCEDRVADTPKIEEHFWNRAKFSKEELDMLSKLPLYYDFKLSGYNIRLMHASPNSVKEKSYFWDFDDGFYKRMETMFKNTEYLGNIGSTEPDIVIFAHIHKPMILRLRNKTLINSGAISNSSDMVEIGGKKYSYGSYLILEGENNNSKISNISYKIVKFTYDYEKEARKILETDMPNKELAANEILTGEYFDRKILHVMAEKGECNG